MIKKSAGEVTVFLILKDGNPSLLGAALITCNQMISGQFKSVLTTSLRITWICADEFQTIHYLPYWWKTHNIHWLLLSFRQFNRAALDLEPRSLNQLLSQVVFHLVCIWENVARDIFCIRWAFRLVAHISVVFVDVGYPFSIDHINLASDNSG